MNMLPMLQTLIFLRNAVLGDARCSCCFCHMAVVALAARHSEMRHISGRLLCDQRQAKLQRVRSKGGRLQERGINKTGVCASHAE
jgi:hypothetical protein